MPGIYGVPEGNYNTNFARSLNRIKVGINKNQVASTQPHLTLGGSFPYEPGTSIGLSIVGPDPLFLNDYISPTEKTKTQHAKSAALSPILKTIKEKKMMKVSFKWVQKYISRRVHACIERYIFFSLLLFQLF